MEWGPDGGVVENGDDEDEDEKGVWEEGMDVEVEYRLNSSAVHYLLH